jgi:dihydroneopterin aldolase
MSLLALEGMEFFSHHGCFEEERSVGTHFLADLFIETDTTDAEATDELQKTLDYQEVFALVKEEMAVSSALIEHVARRILDRVMARFPTVSSTRIKLSKLNPPVGGKVHCVSIQLKAERDSRKA